ncbi:MAG: acyltransferase [Acidobacteria bacterium]|nr:MAG: acyltransferase [Acidobacteriota bacterium]
MLDELARTDRIRLGRFYFRRTLRIFPPYYMLIAVLAVAGAAGVIQLAPHDVARTMTYTSNYYAGRSWFVGHTWSLSVEEQFYLLWPAVLLLAGTRRAFVIAGAVVLLAPVVRVGEWELLRSFGDGVGHRFETIVDAIAMGCLLAGLRPYLHGTTWYPRLLASPLFIIVPVTAVVANLTHDHPLVVFGAALTIMNLAIALSIDWAVTFAEERVGRLLNTAPLVFVGWLSYSLYLWQQPFLNRSSQSALAAFPLNILIVAFLALASYLLVERPALRLRRTLERGRTRSAAPAPSPLDARAGLAADAMLVPQPATSKARSMPGPPVPVE